MDFLCRASRHIKTFVGSRRSTSKLLTPPRNGWAWTKRCLSNEQVIQNMVELQVRVDPFCIIHTYAHYVPVVPVLLPKHVEYRSKGPIDAGVHCLSPPFVHQDIPFHQWYYAENKYAYVPALWPVSTSGRFFVHKAHCCMKFEGLWAM